jgi:hypothetical protein
MRAPSSHSYADIVKTSIKVTWTEGQVMDEKNFDFSKPFLPNRLTGVAEIQCLNEQEKLKLNQIMGNAYCHLFGYIEEYIIPQAMEAAQKDVFGDENRLRALLRFAEEETKHQALFRRAVALFEEGFGMKCGLISAQEEVAKVVLGKSRLCTYLLTHMIEWFTQLHYIEHVRDRSELDGLFRDLLKHHFLDEAQHAKIDGLLIAELAGDVAEADREKAVDELLELGLAIDGLLAQQVGLNITSLEEAVGRRFTGAEKLEIEQHTRRAYRWTFLVAGLEHPNFRRTLAEVTHLGTAKIEAAVEALSRG